MGKGLVFHPTYFGLARRAAAAHNLVGGFMLCLATLGLLAPQPPHVAQLPRLCCGGRRQARPPVMRVSVREAEDAELRFQGGGSRIRPISVLVAQGFVPADASEQQINVMAAQLARNLAQKFSSSNPEDSALLLAESGEEVVAACGVEVMALTPSGLDQFRYEAGDPQGVLADRPFLSNLAARHHVKPGQAQRLRRLLSAPDRARSRQIAPDRARSRLRPPQVQASARPAGASKALLSTPVPACGVPACGQPGDR